MSDGLEQQAQMKAVAEARDRAAFAALFDHFAPRLKAFLIRQGTEASAAEELVQETMLTVWRRAQTFDPAQAGVATWIFTIARNKRIDRLRRENKADLDPYEPMLQPQSSSVEQEIESQQQALRLRRAIAALPPEQGALVRMAYYGDKVHTTIAEETGLALGTVKSRLRLAMKRLRRSLEEDA
ncbi:MAG: sigma-70 family RNA polymerase sigma factor [Rhodospirillales bacterium]